MLDHRNIAFLSATEVLSKLSSAELTSADVRAAIQQQIQSENPGVNAFDSLANDFEPLHDGPLNSLPISVKDQIHVAGMSCNFGLKKADHRLCEKTASVIGNLQKAGASVIGKTNLPPFAMDFQTFNARAGRTNNPWNHAFTAGGSSGGGAAAVAAGMSYIDIGADLAGSLRIPAAYCGVFSFVPSEGEIANDGMLQGDSVLAHFARMGPIARSVDDLMAVWGCLSQKQAPDETGLTPNIAVWNPGEKLPVDDSTADAFRETTKRFQNSDFALRSTDCDGILNDRAYRCFGEIMGYETGGLMPPPARWLGRMFGRSAAKRSPKFLKHVHSGQARNKARYESALNERTGLQNLFDNEYADCDALLLPVSQVSAFEHRLPSSDRNGVRDYREAFRFGDSEVCYLDALTSFTTPVSLLGNPVVTIPLGLDSRGLPVGGQLVGKRGKDWELLMTAKQLASRLNPVSLAPRNVV